MDRTAERLTESYNGNDECIMSLLSEINLSYPNDIVVTVYDNGIISSYTAHELVSDVEALSTAFISMSLTEKVIAIAGQNSYNWIIAYLAGVCAGASVLTVDPKLNPTAMSQQLKLANTELAICDSECYKKLSDRSYDSVIMLDDKTSYAVPSGITSLISTGRLLIQHGNKELYHISRQSRAISHIAFDSGAYGRDKAVTLSARTLYAQIVNASDAIGGNKVYISENLCNDRSLFCAIAAVLTGNTASFSASDLHIYDAADILSPDMLLVSPRTLNDYYVEIWREAERQNIAQALIKRIKTAMTLRHAGLSMRGSTARILRKSGIPIIRAILCFGNNTDDETAFGIHMIGIDLRYAYEVPECGIISFTRKSDGKNTSLGEPLEEMYIKVNEMGQILIKSNAAMSGYLGEGMYPDHWIPTGDTGKFEAGQLILTNDPQKLYITDCAKRVFPDRLADMVKKQIPYARTIVITVDNGIITLHISFDRDFIKITGSHEIRSIVAASVDGVNKCLGEYEQITKTVIDDIA